MSIKDFFTDSLFLADEITTLKAAVDNTYVFYMDHTNNIGPENLKTNGDAYINYVKLKAELISSVSRLMEYKREILKTINEIENPSYRLVLESRYINRMTFEEIAEKTHYDQRHIYRLHKKALDEVEKVLF